MLYNGMDERIQVVTTPAIGAADTRVYLYDLDHRIVGEYGATGTADIKAEYIWLMPEVGATGPTGGDDGLGGYMPLATAVGQTGTLNWLHTHHHGAPILTTNATGAVVPYPAHAVLGFPGQFANSQQLAGAQHYYNRYRDYDVNTGRYIQADPIGLAGDDNPYAYAGGNPLRYMDPSGEYAQFVIGAGIGLATEYFTNPCATAKDLVLAAAWGGIGGGLGKLALLRHGPRARTRDIGLEWSHAIPKASVKKAGAIFDPWTKGGFSKFMNRRGGFNGSWVTPERHFKHDPFRNPFSKGQNRMSDKWHPAIQLMDRIPDWMKASTASGLAGSRFSGGAGCGCK